MNRTSLEQRMALGFPSAETRCGPGSRMVHTEAIRAALPDIVKRYRVKLLCDAGCGDRNWIRHVDLGCEYRGFDYHYGERLDITASPLPQCDLILCRDALIHMPRNLVACAIELFRLSGRYLLATTYSTKIASDLKRLSWRIDMREFLGDAIETVDEPFAGKHMGLWDIGSV